MTVREVEALIPHRAPFLFVDEVVDASEDRLHARRVVRVEEPQFVGHYPGHPIMPGVLLCEAVLQAGCLLLVKRAGESVADGIPVVTRMNNVKFKRIVRPGDTLDILVEHERTRAGAYFMKGTVRVNDKLAASLTFVVMLAAKEDGQ